jgi:hypothetical protein
MLVAWLAVGHAMARVAVVFLPKEVPLEVIYALRIYLGTFLAVFLFLGMALRSRFPAAQLASGLTVVMSLLVLLSGGRSDALFPVFFLGVGFVIAEPVERPTLVRWVAIAVPLFIGAMLFGSLVRQDGRGRTGEAALARVGELGAIVSEASEAAPMSEHTLRRMVSNSNHSVITRIPRELPFEQDGLLHIPSELAQTLLPRFNYGGTSESEVPRHWMLNDLGFLVSWATSVELPLTADAWYRGGYLGLVVVGLILGLFFQLVENAVFRAMRTHPHFSAILLFGMTGQLMVASHDIVSALRTMLFLLIAGVSLVIAARILEARKALPGASVGARRATV